MTALYDKQEYYERIRREYLEADAKARQKNQPAPGLPLLTFSTLRLETFVTGATTFNLPILTGQVGPGMGNVLNTEIRLETNDNFHVAAIGFYIALTTASTDTNFVLKTYPNEIEFGAATAVDYRQIYNGIMKVNVNQVDVLTNYALADHWYVPQTQRISIAAASNRDELQVANDGVLPLAPSIMLSGAYTNTITITLPNAIANLVAANNSRMIVRFLGLRAQNAAIRK